MTELSNDERIVLLIEQSEQLNATVAQQQAMLEKQQTAYSDMVQKFRDSLKLVTTDYHNRLDETANAYKTLDNRAVADMSKQLSKDLGETASREVKRAFDKVDIDGKVNKHANSLIAELDLAYKATNIATEKLKASLEEIESNFGIQRLAVWGFGLLAVTLVIITALAFCVPSLDSIAQRRAEVAELDKKGVNVVSCGANNAQTCVKVDTTKCDKDKGYCLAVK